MQVQFNKNKGGSMDIRSKRSGDIIFSDFSKTIKECVESAIKSEKCLIGSDFRGSNLTRVNLTSANLIGANIDFSCLPLWCWSKGIIIDKKQAKQLGMHVFNLIERFWPGGLTKDQKEWLNESHRITDGSFPEF